MRRREFTVVLLSASLLPLTGETQSKIYRIGVLETQPATLNAANLDAFREGLREAGYIEGKTLSSNTDPPMAALSGFRNSSQSCWTCIAM